MTELGIFLSSLSEAQLLSFYVALTAVGGISGGLIGVGIAKVLKVI